ncbi:FAD-linked oxidoreductase-like protein [Gymnopilus junonius]|uniref:Proline dehydrogenase n=1 Tax=Gymnopilus junonius TaxID=109634 RepID=A0A9P5TQK6_GYMJU|nr:FAD-linked oxidoreductase-like protein [Gymnopilus junonius]
MLLARFGSLAPKRPVLSTARHLSFSFRPSRAHRGNAAFLTRRAVARTALFSFTLTSGLLASSIYADSDTNAQDGKKKGNPSVTSLGSLVRAYVVYTMCSVPALVDASPKLLSVLSSVPGLKQITEAFVRITFFDQFVGADTAEESIPLLHSLRAANKGVLFAYSVEVDEKEATGASTSLSSTDTIPNSPPPSSVSPSADGAYTRIVDEMVHCIDVAADFEDGLSKNSGVADNSFTHETVPVNAKGRRTWVAVKMTALLPDANALRALSARIVASRKALPSPEALVPFPGSPRIEDLGIISSPLTTNPNNLPPLTPEQIRDIRELYANLHRICKRASERGVKIIMDAEYSWYQPAIDALTLALMREFNSLDQKSRHGGYIEPLIYGTFQAYLRRTPSHIALALEDAKKNNYSLGVKLVRGAYHSHELAARHAALALSTPSLSISPEVDPPVWLEKKDSDATYNKCVGMLVRAVKEDLEKQNASVSTKKGAASAAAATSETPSLPGLGVLFGTHNWDSCALILKELVLNGLAVEEPKVSGNNGQAPIRVGEDVTERVAIGQLYGMTDNLTDWVVNRVVTDSPFVIKYVPYGALAEVMPYLSRRAIENKSVLGDGNAAYERQRAGQEIWKKIFG